MDEFSLVSEFSTKFSILLSTLAREFMKTLQQTRIGAIFTPRVTEYFSPLCLHEILT